MIGEDSCAIIGLMCHNYICPITDLGMKIDSSERVLLTKGGKKKPVLKTVINPQLGGIDVLIESFIDITELKQAEQDLRSTQEKLKEAHRLSHIGTWTWVKETDTVTWSEELYHIAVLDPATSAPTFAEHPRIYTPDSWARLNNAVSRAFNTGEPYNL